MNPLNNPFAPGAGTPPPELAGRDELLGAVHVAAERTRRRLAARNGIAGAGQRAGVAAAASNAGRHDPA